MALCFNRSLDNGIQILVWYLSETLNELEKQVQLNDDDAQSYVLINVPAKKREFLAGKYVLEKACDILGIEFLGIEKDEHGKPHIKGREYEISLTHTDHYIGVVFSKDFPVGIDLESPREQILRVFPRLFSKDEVETVGMDLEKATIYWSAKEALYKLYGKRSVDFRKHLLLTENNGELQGNIHIGETNTYHNFYIDKIENFYLIVAY